MGPCEEGNGPVDAITGKEFRDQVNIYHFPRRTLHHGHLGVLIIPITNNLLSLQITYGGVFLVKGRVM
jgi:hypothetical protein